MWLSLFSRFISGVFDLFSGCIRLAAWANVSVSNIGEGSHNHDCDDHGATEEGNVR